MKIYKDATLTEEIKDKILDFGTVLAGDSKEYTYYLYNDLDAQLVDLVFGVDNKEVSVVSAPKDLKYKEIGRLILKYSPSVTLKQGLRKEPLHIKGYEIYS